jgi:hypothetical protein
MDSRNEELCDSVGYAPGANDDGSGTAIAMELARVASKQALESTLILMPVTGEEQGLLGSEAYAEFALQQGIRIDGVITCDVTSNVEGCVDPSCPPGEPLLVDSMSVRHFSGDPENGISRQLARYMKIQSLRYTPAFTVNLIAALDRPGRGGDHIPFYDRGFASVRFTEAVENGDGTGENGRQHNMFDTISALNTNEGYMARIAQVNMAGLGSLALAPETPGGLEAFDGGNGEEVLLTWPQDNAEPDFAGYMIALRDPDSLFYGEFHDAGNAGEYLVSGLSPDVPVYFSHAAYDIDGNLSVFSAEILFAPTIIPRQIENPDATSRESEIALQWDASPELDVVTYRIYRSLTRTSGYAVYDSTSEPVTDYVDAAVVPHTLYFYYITAVDADGNESPASATVSGRLTTHDLGILLVDGTRDGNGTVLSPTDAMVDDYYLSLLQGYVPGGHYDVADSVALGLTVSDADMAEYSTVVWHTDVRGSSPLHADTSSLRKYLQQGGRLLLCGWKLSTSLKLGATIGLNTYPEGSFVPEVLKVDSTFTSGALTQDFITAVAAGSGYTDVSVDSAKIPLYGGTLVNTDAILPPFADPLAEVLYTHHGAIPGSILEGKPVGWRYSGTTYQFVVFDFPPYYMESGGAGTALRKALMDLGEPTDVSQADGALIPEAFVLYQNYPNPFNPSTRIRFDMPETGWARIVVYNVLGQRIAVPVDGELPAGSHSIDWDGRGTGGLHVSSGVYFYRITVTPARGSGETRSAVRSMVLLR